MSAVNTVINVKPESRDLLKQLSDQSGLSMRSVVEEALVFYVEKTQDADNLMFLLQARIEREVTKAVNKVVSQAVHKAIDDVLKEVRERQAYKPYLRLGRGEADDIKELPEEGDSNESK